MCGIVGKMNFNKEKINKEEILKMLSVIKHRGPDGNDFFIKNNLGLGHALLKIQDLTDFSLQPYESENYVLTYNGEIYNFLELKKELIQKGINFYSSGDTEVLIKYIEYAGLEETLQKIEGCFAIALYDKRQENLYIVRDRFGIKPLYYYMNNNKIIFASEIKSILTDNSVKRKFDLETVAISINCRLWMDPVKTLFKDIYMLEPGTYLKIDRYFNLISPCKGVKSVTLVCQSSKDSNDLSLLKASTFTIGLV